VAPIFTLRPAPPPAQNQRTLGLASSAAPMGKSRWSHDAEPRQGSYAVGCALQPCSARCARDLPVSNPHLDVGRHEAPGGITLNARLCARLDSAWGVIGGSDHLSLRPRANRQIWNGPSMHAYVSETFTTDWTSNNGPHLVSIRECQP
jgi:hypothetical protein